MKTANARLALLLAIVLAALASPASAAKDIPYEWNGVPRIVAIGDVHGAYNNFVALLKNAGLVDDELNWIGGKTHLVQNGDVVDRGPNSRKCMDLLMKLEKRAKRAGGRVHALIGNHEAMDIVGILDLVSPEEFASYRDAGSERRRNRAFWLYYRDLKAEAKANGEPVPEEEEARRGFDSRYPLGYIEHRRAFDPKGRYGGWILKHNVAVRINGIVFSHGDWSEEISALGLEEVNRRVREELSGSTALVDGITFHPKGPLQYRGLAEVTLQRAAQEAQRLEVERILSNLGATRMVVAHTVTSGIIEPRFGGKHISIDLGMLEIYRGGHQVALEIEGDVLRAIHPGGKVPLPVYLDESNLVHYLEAVAAVDPDNIGIHTQLAEQYQARGELDKARRVLEELFQSSKPVPIRFRQMLGSIYGKLGARGKAREQHLAYIESVKEVIKASPDNVNLLNLLARFCLEHGLQLDLAEESIRRALEREPDNKSFQLTRSRVHMSRGQFVEAARVLEAIIAREAGYEPYFYLGLAYRRMDQIDKARRAFELALEEKPGGSEARQELRKLGEPDSGQWRESHDETGMPFYSSLFIRRSGLRGGSGTCFPMPDVGMVGPECGGRSAP
ncbi:MAG: metallophosphoesterase [Acidobacteriota bacterium]